MDHEFRFDKSLQDNYNFGNVNGFQPNNMLKFKAPTLNFNNNNLKVDGSKTREMHLGQNEIETKISLSKILPVGPEKKIVALLEVRKYSVTLPFEINVTCKISGTTKVIIGTLTANIYKDPKITTTNVSDVQNCYFRGTKTVLPSGEVNCDCDPGFKGNQCEEAICDMKCVNGTCKVSVDDKNNRLQSCECFKDFIGVHCDKSLDQVRIEGNKACRGNQCFCLNDWYGEDCDERLAPLVCSGHGREENGFCQCDEGWQGEQCDCTTQYKCFNEGTCKNNFCYCKKGWSGQFCEVPIKDILEEFKRKTCFNNCSGNGKCDNATCNCLQG
mmetsp:Transcript_106080/g.228544  ORF Transcript_106080/g.228544 Transcript_106080/m.228544 type:complete len:328 (+) Transcript_106080:478-1461(+)